MPEVSTVTRAFVADHPGEAAAILEALPVAEVASFLAEVPAELAALLLRWMTPTPASACFHALETGRATEVLRSLPLDSAASLLRRQEDARAQAILAALPGSTAEALRRLLQQDEGSAGALADPGILALPRDVSVEEALARLRSAPQRAIYYLYVVDRDDRLVGVLTIRELLLAPPHEPLSNVMTAPVDRLAARSRPRVILEHPGWRMYHAMPVVDDRGVLVGAIRYETLRDLERRDDGSAAARNSLVTASSLGELVWVSMAGLFAGITGGGEAVAPPPRRSDEARPRREGEP